MKGLATMLVSGLRIVGSDAAAPAFRFDFSPLPDGSPPSQFTGGTWSVSNGLLINSPDLGAEALENGSMETGDPPTGWSSAGSTAVLDGVANPRPGSAGSQALSLVNNGANYGSAQKAFTTVQHGIIFLDAWIRNVTCNTQITVPGAVGQPVSTSGAGTDWVERKSTFYVTTAAGALFRLTNANNTAGFEARADDASVKYHTLSQLFCTLPRLPRSPMTVKSSLTIPVGSWGGVVAHLDSQLTPQNFVLAFHDRTNIHLLTMVNGVWQAQLINVANTYVDKAIIEIRQTGPTTYQLWYNGSQVGADQTIDSPALNTNIYHGLFGTYGGVGAKNFVCDGNDRNPNRFLVLGDSISAATGSWAYSVCSDYNWTADLTNLAVSGAHIMNDYAENLTNQVAAAANVDATKIFIALGTNDNNAGDMSAMQTLLETQLAVLKADHPNAEIYYLNVLPRWTSTSGETPVDKSHIRATILAACSNVGIPVWDTFEMPWLMPGQSTDGLHPNTAGHVTIALEVLTRLGTNPAADLYDKLSMPSQAGRDVMLQYIDASSRYVWTPVISRYWVRWKVIELASGFWQTQQAAVYSTRKPVNDDDAGIAYGGMWDSFPVVGSLNNTTRRSLVIGDYVEFSITGTDEAYISVTKQANCGYGWVTVNGGTALANGSGLADDGADHRYFDGYAAAQTAGQRVQVATGLDPSQTYTIRVTHSGEKAPEATDHRVYFEGYIIDAYQISDGAGLPVEKTLVQGITTGVSALEYAYQYEPTGTSVYEFTGSAHLNELISATTWKDQDGADVVVSAGTPTASVEKLLLVNTGTSRHSQTGATDHANLVCRVTFDHLGVEVYHKHDWLSAAEFYAAYPAMIGTDPAYTTKGYIVGREEIEDLTLDDNRFAAQVESRLARAWSDTSDWITWLYLPNLAGVGYWENARASLSIQDTSVNNKIYGARCGFGSVVTVAPGESWESIHRIFVTFYDHPENLPWV